MVIIGVMGDERMDNDRARQEQTYVHRRSQGTFLSGAPLETTSCTVCTRGGHDQPGSAGLRPYVLVAMVQETFVLSTPSRILGSVGRLW